MANDFLTFDEANPEQDSGLSFEDAAPEKISFKDASPQPDLAPPPKQILPDSLIPKPNTPAGMVSVNPDSTQSRLGSGTQIIPTVSDIKNALPDSEDVHQLKDSFDRQAVSYQIPVNKDDSIPTAVGKEVANLAMGIPEFFTSPTGALSLAGGEIAPKTITALFTGDVLHGLGSTVLDTYKNWGQMGNAEKAKAVVDIFGSLTMAGLLGGGLAHQIKSERASKNAAALITPVPNETQPNPETKVEQNETIPIAETKQQEIAPTIEAAAPAKATEAQPAQEPATPVNDVNALPETTPQVQNSPIAGAVGEAPKPTAPSSLIAGLTFKPISENTHDIYLQGQPVGKVFHYIDPAEIPTGSTSRQPYRGFDALYYKNDPTTGQPTIYIPRDYTENRRNPLFTHEVTHLMTDLGVIKPEEVNAVVDQYAPAGSDYYDTLKKVYDAKLADNQMPPLDDAGFREEVFANLMQDWHENQLSGEGQQPPKTGFIQRAFDFVRNLFGLKPSAPKGQSVVDKLQRGKVEVPQTKPDIQQETPAPVLPPPEQIIKPEPIFEPIEKKSTPEGEVKVQDNLTPLVTTKDGGSRVRYFNASGKEVGYGLLDGKVINLVHVEPQFRRKGFGAAIVADLRARGGEIGVAGTPEGLALMRSDKVGAREYEKNRFDFQSGVESKPAPPKPPTSLEALNTSPRVNVKLPNGATMVRVTTRYKGRDIQKVMSKKDLEKFNPFHGSENVKITPGTMSQALGAFKAMEGEVKITPREKPKSTPQFSVSEKSDYDQYQEAQKKMADSEYGSPEFMAAWADNERIKNRNKGMPPSAPVEPPKFSANREEKDSTTAAGNYIETQVMGSKVGVAGKEGTFSKATLDASTAYAKTVFDKVGIDVVPEQVTNRRGQPATLFRLVDWRTSENEKDDVAGQKLVEEIQSQLNQHREGEQAPDLIVNLLRSIVMNYEEGTMGMFSDPIQQQLFNLSHGDFSVAAAFLGAAAHFSKTLVSTQKNLQLWLRRSMSTAFGGDAYESFFKRIIENFHSFFTPEEIAAVQNESPQLTDMLNRYIAQNHQDYGGRVYRKVQNQWREKFSPKRSQLENDARINEAAQAIIEEAKKRFNIEPKPSKKKDITPYEKLLHMVNDGNAEKIGKLMDAAVADAEYNAGTRAMQDAVKTETDPAKKQTLIDHLTLMAADKTVLPLPEYVEKGLALPEYANWKTVRDNWFDYSPVSMRLIEKVISGDFRGTKFGKENPSAKPVDTRLDLSALAKSPDDEVKRVLDAYQENYDTAMKGSGATDATRARISQLMKERLAEQLEKARARFREPMFRDAKTKGVKLTPEQAIAQELNAGLFKDIRLDIPAMVEKVASKSKITKLLPKTSDLIKQILDTPAFKQSDIEHNFVNKLINDLGVPEDQAQNAWKVFSKAFESRFLVAREKALQTAREKLLPKEQDVLPKDNPFWKKVQQFVNAGGLDSSELLEQIAHARHGWIKPTEATVKLIKRLVEEEQNLRTLPKSQEAQIRMSHPEMPDAEMAKLLELKRQDRAALFVNERSELIRRLGVEWTRMTRPINFLKYFSSKYRKNNAQALNEYMTLDMLLKAGFATFRLPVHISTQLVLHTATRAVGEAVTVRDNDIRRGVSRRKVDTQFWKDVHEGLSTALKTSLASMKVAAISARAEILGRGESRNMDRIMSGINATERLAAWANREAEKGNHVGAVLLHLLNLPRVVAWYVSAIDHFQGKPVEYQEMLRKIEIEMRENGKSRAEIAANKDQIFKMMTSEFPVAVADTRTAFDAEGKEASERQIEEGAVNLVRQRLYQKMESMGLPADAFEQHINLLKSTVAWQEKTTHGIGGSVATGLRTLAGVFENAGIPTSITRLSNAIGTGINYSLMNIPLLYKFAAYKTAGSVGESPWFRTDLDRNHRMVQSIVGGILGTTVGALALTGLAKVNLGGPRDKKERDMWIKQGHRPGTVEFNLPDGTFIPISLAVGPMSLYAPYLTTFGAVHRLAASREKAQQKLNQEAEKKGLPPGKIKPISSLDVLAVAGSALAGSLLSSRTASGLTASVTEQGIPNAQKLAASFVAPLVPGLPAYQEIARMMGVQMDPKTASVWDYLVPLPTSPHRSVNVLGEPVETEDDVQRIVQVITAGSYPLPVDPNAVKSQTAYNAMFETGYVPPTINPSKGYNINGTFRPMNDSELQAYTIARGQNLKEDLSALGENPTKQQVQAAYKDANARALSSVGVAAPTTAASGQSDSPSASKSKTVSRGTRMGSLFGKHRRGLTRLNKIGTSHRKTGRTSLLRSHHRRHALA